MTCEDVDAAPPAGKPKPVIPVAAMGETAMSPMMEDGGTVEMPDFVRIV